MPVEEYAMKFVETIRSFPADRSVWLQTHRWFGNYRPHWGQHNVLAHIGDATREGTPGIWPHKGKMIWFERQRKFLAILREQVCRLGRAWGDQNAAVVQSGKQEHAGSEPGVW